MAIAMGGLGRKAGATALALAALLAATSCTVGQKVSGGPQGWTAKQQSDWYGATQGSRLIPLDWAMALEAPGGGKFFEPASLARFRLLPRDPGTLPVGMTIDRQDDTGLPATALRWAPGQGKDAAWLGLNCSACHTGEIAYKGTHVRIDGGPSLFDFQSFVDGVAAALGDTRNTPAKWDAFAKAVLKGGDTPAARTMLGQAVDSLRARNARIAAANGTVLTPGYARVDAFGRIFNMVGILAGPDAPKPHDIDAPVSYPFLWNTSQADRVQWNGLAENIKAKIGAEAFDYGALGRNAGEVIGVYGDVDVIPDAGLKGFRSSVGIVNLSDLERLLAKLRPPVWPAALMGTPDAAKVAAGEALFAQHCAGCHTHLASDDITTPYTAKMALFADPHPPGTDPWMACNAYSLTQRTGNLEGQPQNLVHLPGNHDPDFGDTAPVATMLKTTVLGAMIRQKGALIQAAATTWLGIPPRPQVNAVALPNTKAGRLERCMTEQSRLLGYRSRPLTGIWATAPYLHNGSVPTLWDLLLPPAARPATFNVGSRDFDPVRVGYVTAPSAENSFRFVTRDANGPIAGNSNAGHDYGNAGFSDADRWALVEYMKTL